MKFPFFGKKSEKEEVYLGLFIKEEGGIALIMKWEQGRLSIKEKESFKYSNGWENLTEDIDETLYKLEKNLNIQINQTIFFVYSHLIDEKSGEIKKPFLVKIKELVKNLELKVLGYIECFEAVSFYLEKTEEVPLTAVLLEMDKHQMSLFVFIGGKISYRRSISRTDNIVEDIISALDNIKGKAMLPSRMILYDSDNIDDSATQIITKRWSEDYFAQIPKIDIISQEKVLEGLTDVFAVQIKPNKAQVEDEKEKTESGNKFGFVVGQDIAEIQDSEIKIPVEARPKFNLGLLIAKIDLSFLKLLKGKFAVILGTVIIFISLFLNEYFFHQAQITIYLPSHTLKKEMTEEIEYRTASVTADFNQSVTTSGKKVVGDKAKGSIIIHNFDSIERIFTKGTKLTANNLEFILDSDIKVASSTIAADGSAKLPGKASGSITAADIGFEGNLGKGQRFKIDDLSMENYFGINDSTLSGGSKKEVRIVTKADYDNLKAEILNKAKKEVKTPTLSMNESIIADLTQVNLEEEKFSQEIGKESDNVSLSAKIKTIFYFYNRTKLNKKIVSELKKNLKPGFRIDEKSLSYRIVDSAVKKNLLKIDLQINAKAIKEFDQDSIMNKIIGQTPSKLEKILKSEVEIQAYDVSIKEPFLFLKNHLPFFKKNITLKVSSL